MRIVPRQRRYKNSGSQRRKALYSRKEATGAQSEGILRPSQVRAVGSARQRWQLIFLNLLGRTRDEIRCVRPAGDQFQKTILLQSPVPLEEKDLDFTRGDLEELIWRLHPGPRSGVWYIGFNAPPSPFEQLKWFWDDGMSFEGCVLSVLAVFSFRPIKILLCTKGRAGSNMIGVWQTSANISYCGSLLARYVYRKAACNCSKKG